MSTTAKISGNMTVTKYRVFVYGTLKRGESNHRLLARSRFVGVATTEPRFRLLEAYGGAYPYLVAGQQSIRGEVYEIDGGTLYSLDRLEGYRADSEVNHYNRETITVTIDDEQVEAMVYVLNENNVSMESCTEYDGNEWKSRRSSRHQ